MSHRHLLTTALALASALTGWAGLTFTGLPDQPVSVTPEATSGLNDLYVVYQTAGVKAVYTAASATATVKWYRYSQLGGGYAEELQGIAHSGREWTLTALQPDMGYIIEEGSSRYYCWVADYSAHPYSVTALTLGPEQDCDRISLVTTGSAEEMTYYSINGRRITIDRDIHLIYNTMTYDEESAEYAVTEATDTYPYISGTVHATAPLCDTQMRLMGDRFLRAWGHEQTAISPMVQATAVACESTVTVDAETPDNQQTVAGGEDSGILGGSAPLTLEMHAAVTEAAIFREWQMSRYEDFSVIDMRFNSLDATYTLLDQGTTYLRFMAANAAGTCDAYGPTYTLFIGDSALECPNAFSPGASPGVNDEWKVSYKSIIEFECHIFNRYGTKMATLTSPSQGWDGKYGGKVVPAGVYYYVITAKGADGKEYKLSGDINIINYK